MAKKMPLGKAFQKVYEKKFEKLPKDKGQKKLPKEQEDCLKRGYTIC